MRALRSAAAAPDHESDIPDKPKLVSTKIAAVAARKRAGCLNLVADPLRDERQIGDRREGATWIVRTERELAVECFAAGRSHRRAAPTKCGRAPAGGAARRGAADASATAPSSGSRSRCGLGSRSRRGSGSRTRTRSRSAAISCRDARLPDDHSAGHALPPAGSSNDPSGPVPTHANPCISRSGARATGPERQRIPHTEDEPHTPASQVRGRQSVHEVMGGRSRRDRVSRPRLEGLRSLVEPACRDTSGPSCRANALDAPGDSTACTRAPPHATLQRFARKYPRALVGSLDFR